MLVTTPPDGSFRLPSSPWFALVNGRPRFRQTVVAGLPLGSRLEVGAAPITRSLDERLATLKQTRVTAKTRERIRDDPFQHPG